MHKFHGPRAGFEFITGIDQDVIHSFIIALESFCPWVTLQSLPWRCLHYPGDTSRVIRLNVINHQVINFGRVNYTPYPAKEFIGQCLLYRINENNLFIHN